VARIPLVGPTGDGPPSGEPLDANRLSPNVLRAIANHPRAAEAFGAFGAFLYSEPSITPAQRELAYLTASAVNNCHY
jgi:alkylhydroperoxidase family enzyme